MSRGYVESRNILFSDHYGNGNFDGPFSRSNKGRKQRTTDESEIPDKRSVISSTEKGRNQATNLKNVKRKLDFNDEEGFDSARETNHGDLDFTDKMAAFRAILKPMKEESRSFGKRLLEKKTFNREDDLSSDNSSKRRLLESESNSSSLFSGSADLDLKALYRNGNPKSLLSRLADQELARQSYINYEANSFVWLKLKQELHSRNSNNYKTEEQSSETSSHGKREQRKGKKSIGRNDESDRDYLSKYDSLLGKGKVNNRKEKLGEDKIKTRKGISGKNSKKEKKREGLSEGNENARRGKRVVCDNIEYKQDEQNMKTQGTSRTFQSRFESDLDNIPQREISDICKLICDSETMCQNNSTEDIKSLPLTHVPNQESPRHSEFSKNRQSNVPLFSESLTPRQQHLSHRKDDVLKMQIDGLWNRFSREAKYEDFPKGNMKMNDGFLSPDNKEFKQTNVEHYVGTPRSDLPKKNTETPVSSMEKSPTSPKRKKSGSRSKDLNKRNHSKSPDRKKRVKNIEKIEDLNLSDSSKENIPSSRIKITNGVPEDNGILTIHDLSSSQNERKRNERQSERKKNEKLNTEAKSDNLQFIPEKETKNKNKDHSDLPVDGYVLHNTEKLSDVESRNSDITSITGSARSSGSQSSTVRAVELLRRLYKTDPQTRENLILKARCFRRWLKNVKKLRYKYDGNESDNWYVFRALQQDMQVETENADMIETCDTKVSVHGDLVKGDNRFESMENHGSLSEIDSAMKGIVQKNGIKSSARGQRSDGSDIHHTKTKLTSENSDFIEMAGNETVHAVHLLNADHVTKTKESGQYQLHSNIGSSASKPQSNSVTHSKFGVPLMNGNKQMTGVVMGNFGKRGTPNKNGENLASADSLGNIALTETAQLLDTVNYGMCLQRAEIFYRHLFLKKYFNLWKQMTVEHMRYKSAADMARKHLLRKAMKGFMWSINRSKIQVDIFQSRMKSISLMTTFTKWRNSAMENRQRRLRVAFSRWQEFTVESQKIRRLRQLADKKILVRSLHQWKVRFSMRLKENAADYHYRKKLLSVQITHWKIFTQQSKEKWHRNNMAIEFRKEHLQRVMFTEMVVVFKKHSQAQQHYRIVELRRVFMSWLRSAHVCKVERQRDMSISKEHWRMVTIKHYFVQWHEELLTHRATKSSNRKLLKNSFLIWRTRWQENLQYRLAVEAEIRQQILRASLRLWFDNVRLLKQRREVAVVYMQRVLVRHMLKKWSLYTEYRKELRMIHKDFVEKLNLKKEETFWKTWRSKFQDRLDVQKAQTFWSNSCVRKAVDRWKRKCHKSSLQQLLQTSEPDRQLNLQRVMFNRWLVAKQNIEAEKQEADQTRKILERSQLLQRFKTWRVATQQLLTIKPMLMRRERHTVTRVFDEWQNLVKHKAQCRKNKEMYIRSRLSKLFSSWKQQYQLHQIEKEVKQKTIKNQLHRCVDGWRFVIKRKHTAVKFCQKNLVKSMFVYWRDKAFCQLHDKMEAKEIQEWNTSLLKYYFDLWFTNVQQQITEKEEVTILMEQQRSVNLIKSSFTSWRRHFRATLVAREYQKMQSRKMLQQLFVKWNEVTKYSLKEAVHKFATRLGLQSLYQDEFTNSTGSESGGISDQLRALTEFEDFDGEADVDSGHLSPYSSSTLGTPIKRLFSPALSRVSVDLDRSLQEVDFQPSLSNTSFIDARFAMEQAVKTERLKEIVFLVIKRIRFWPVSTMFDQWKEYTIQQRQFKHLSAQVVSMCNHMETKLVFREWRAYYTDCIKAKTHWEMLIKRKTFKLLFNYKCERQWKKKLSALASNHHALMVYKKIFPQWYNKAQDKRQKEKIVHLWTNVTSEEQSLIPKEEVIVQRLHKRNTKKYFAIWYFKFQQIHKLRTAYNNILLQKVVTAWKTWAHNKAEQRRKSNNFRETHLKSLVFKTWCLRREQKLEVEAKHKQAWQRYLSEILTSWSKWAKVTRHQCKLSDRVVKMVNTHTLQLTFTTWRALTIKQQQVTVWHNNKVKHMIIEAWHSITVYKKQLRRKVLDFQVKSYTKHTIRMFNIWHQRYLEKLKEHEEYSKLLERNALKIGRKWMKIAQKSRGKHLQQVFMQRKMQQCFQKWKHGYERNMEREDQLQRYVSRKNWHIMGQCMDTWRTTLMGKQAKRLYEMKLKATIFSEWHVCASVSRKQQRDCQIMQTALQQRTMKSYFVYWHNITVVQQSIQKHYNLKLKIRVLRSWHVYVKKQRHLRSLQLTMTKRVNLHILQNTWYAMRGQFDYFHSLTELAEKVVQEKNQICLRQALSVWRERLNRVIAGHCYQHLLALRAIRKWRRFVYQKKMERKHEQDMLNKATRHYNLKLCKKVMTAWMDEIHVQHQILRHKARISNKYGRLWKLKVDMMYTAKCVERETEMKKSWKKWRLEFVKRRTAKTISDYNEKMLLSQVFHAWKSLYLKKPAQKRGSSIPIPVLTSQTQNLQQREQSAIPVPTQSSQQQRDQTQIPAPNYITRPSSTLTRKASFSKKY